MASKYGNWRWQGSLVSQVTGRGEFSQFLNPGHYRIDAANSATQRAYYLRDLTSGRSQAIWGPLEAQIIGGRFTLRQGAEVFSPAPISSTSDTLVWTPPVALEDRTYEEPNGIGLIVPVDGACPIEISLNHTQAGAISFGSPFPGPWEVYDPSATDPNVPIYRGEGPPRLSVPPTSGWIFTQRALI